MQRKYFKFFLICDEQILTNYNNINYNKRGLIEFYNFLLLINWCLFSILKHVEKRTKKSVQTSVFFPLWKNQEIVALICITASEEWKKIYYSAAFGVCWKKCVFEFLIFFKLIDKWI